MAQRPFILDPLFAPLTILSGVGGRVGKALEKLIGGPKILDLLRHLPIDIIDRRYSPKLADVKADRVATLHITVQTHFPPDKRSQPWRVWCTDETGAITLVFFHARGGEWIRAQLPEKSRVVVSGRVESFNDRLQMVHPDIIGTSEEFDQIAVAESLYPLTAGLTNRMVNKAIKGALANLSPLPEWLDMAWKAKQGWPSWDEALRGAHAMKEGMRERLAYDELLAHQLTLSIVRARQRRMMGRVLNGTCVLQDKIRAATGFILTRAQERTLAEIGADMAAPHRMARLLQGDVGAGKTIVAALAMARAVESGVQAALMAPTEILVRQHAKTLSPWLEAAGIQAVILTGQDKGAARREILGKIADGTAQIILGTHAIFQKEVIYSDLALVVVDEQHKFGVEQRLALANKGMGVDMLLMTATPIPRSLALTLYGDMDISRLDEKPPGRRPVETRLMSMNKTQDLVAALARRIARAERVYWVCPLVEESEVVDFVAATKRYEDLRAVFGQRVGLVHGRMTGAEKEEVMVSFARGDLDILVATTVIEVGVDVKEATIMVVEEAQRFGLAQLHQLRGRVGRGMQDSYCFLLYQEPLQATARARLCILRESQDGFILAEEDLCLRGSGDILGLRQSGEAVFYFADMAQHGDLLRVAHDDARLIMERDVELVSERGKALRILLYLFERDRALRYLRAG